MITTKDKLDFVFAMARHSKITLSDCKRLMRYAATLQRLAEKQCNDPKWSESDENKREAIKTRVRTLTERLGEDGLDGAVFSNDPRGAVIKVRVTDGFTTDWGREGICVPS